ncbi:hypothetical protein JW813_16745 [Clostridium botulinum]|uniref:hypothetical protein n=1 Tax=Clostridium botulinum TaxID=1491 RepID=UPI0022464868|nr:hypothetical protein [Clostridium botulinum]UZP03335.1 hypothetical protein JW813_16745 [Clostridium botulinum]UZP06693.1 hypothetical protein JYA71_17015 [Clostridium botulinum]UZP10074.1 hypothetical protein JYA74_16740 [Clostridium botulinum]
MDNTLMLKFQNLNNNLEKSEKSRSSFQDPKVFIFTSIDLVNSTSYKQYDTTWPTVFSEFFGIVESEFKKRNENLYIWKYVGDEVLFFEEINSINSILKAPSETFKIMELCEKMLYANMPNCKNILYLKATLWIAPIKSPTDNSTLHINNVTPNLSATLIDFIGADVDEGFRISKFSSQNKLVLDSKLAYILLENEDSVNKLCDYCVEDRIKIVGYKKLKGIWNNRLYPIIWYHKSWSNLDSMFLYDEYDSSEIAKDLHINNQKLEPISKLKKILTEANILDTKIIPIMDIINSSNKESYIEHPSILENMIELYCSAVCFNPEDNTILIAKRSKNKRSPSQWEFGCIKSTKNNTIKECLENFYKDEFNITIELIMEKDRTDCQPIPLSIYSVNKHEGIHKGIIFLAKVLDMTHMNFNDFKKHCEIRWINENDVQTFNEDTVPDFKNSLNKAFKYIKDNLLVDK